MTKETKAFKTNPLPPGWKWVKVGDHILTITPTMKVQQSNYALKGDYPIIDQSNNFISGWTDNRDALISLPSAALIFGDHTCMAKYIDFPFVQGADGIKIIQSNELMCIKYLYWILKIRPLSNEGYRRHFALLCGFSMPLPPIEEQKRIVEILDKKMALVEKLKQLVKNQLLHVKALRQAYLSQTFKTDPLPPGWKLVRIEDICQNQILSITQAYSDSDIVNYIDITSIDNIKKRITNPKQLIVKYAPSRARQVVSKNDVLISTTRPNLNAVALIGNDLDGYIASTGFCVLRPKDDISMPFYLFMFSQTKHFIESLSNLVNGALYPAVTNNQVKNQLIPLPPIEEQKRIVEILDKKMELIEKLDNQLLELEKLIEAIPQSYLKLAFSGKLTQDFRENQNNQTQTEPVVHG